MNQTTSVNLSNNHKLINFCVSNHLIKKFDDLIKVKRVTRTSVLVKLMETYLRYELKQMEEDNNNYKKVVNQVSNDNQKPPQNNWRRRDEYKPRTVPLHNEVSSWEDSY